METFTTTQPDIFRRMRWFKHPFSLIYAMVVLLVNLFVAGLVYQMLQQSRTQYEALAVAASQNVASLLEQSTEDSIERIELALFSVTDEISRQMASGRIDKELLNAYITRLHSRLPELEGLRVTNVEGIVSYGINVPDNSTVSIANDEHFPYLRDHPDAGTIISKPKFGKISGKWTIKVVRRYNNPDGSFAGVVSGIVDLDHFASHFASINIGSSGAIVLRDNELRLIVRYPELENRDSVIGKNLASQKYFEMFKQQPLKGTFVAPSPFDGIERTNFYHKVGKWPLYIQVATATEDFLGEWRVRVRNSILAVAVFVLLSILLTWSNYRYWVTRRTMTATLEENQRMFRSLAQLSSDAFWELDTDFRLKQVSGTLLDKIHCSPENYLGKTRWEIAVDTPDDLLEKHKATLFAHLPFQDFEYSLLNDAGEKFTLSISGEPIMDERGTFLGYRGTSKDITERRQYEERIEHMAQYDNLTELPNRALFYDRLQQALAFAKREQNGLALLYLDLDNFKQVNDTMGHHAGDQLLKQVASRIEGLLRKSDTVARLGGDEFALILSSPGSREDTERIAHKIIDAMHQTFTVEGIGQTAQIGASIGVALFPSDAENDEELLKAADTAMYRAKQSGNTCRFYS
jgi:diguanylate cyclase (GGDEF)-like protein/PAS domain S-box-containing protein